MEAPDLQLILANLLPETTEENPFAQVDFAYTERSGLNRPGGSADSYLTACNVFKEFLVDTLGDGGGKDRFCLAEALPWDVHFRYYKWLVAQGERFVATTIDGHLSTLKQVVQYCRAHKYIRHEVFFVSRKKVNRMPATTVRSAYEDDLLGSIRDLVGRQYREIKSMLSAEQTRIIDIGRDPRQPKPLDEGLSACLPALEVIRDSTARGVLSPRSKEISKITGKIIRNVRIACDYWLMMGIFERIEVKTRNYNSYHYVLTKEPDADMLRDADPDTYGWASIDNLAWYTQNVLNGVIPQLRNHDSTRNPTLPVGFVGSIERMGGIEVFQSRLHDLGIWSKYSKRLSTVQIGSVMAMLAMVTGLNVEGMRSLEIDCIKTEPISGKPCLQYVKLRSTGVKALSLVDDEDLDLYSDSPDVRSGKQSLLYFNLLPDSEKVREIVDTALKLTAEIREEAPDDLKNRLFIYSGLDGVAKQSADENGGTQSWQRAFKRSLTNLLQEKERRKNLDPAEFKVRQDEIESRVERMNINLSRFRSTLATELALSGAPLEMIQAVLGHRNRRTTRQYLERRQMEIAYHDEVTKALNNIKNNKHLHLVRCDNEDDLSKMLVKDATPESATGYIFETGTPLYCRNPYDPSDEIKENIKGWVDGKSTCHRWNKCLFCDQVVIVDYALPKLIAYHDKLKRDLEDEETNVPGQGELLAKTVSLIAKIIDPAGGFFDARTIKDARTRAEVFSAMEADQYFYEGVVAWR